MTCLLVLIAPFLTQAAPRTQIELLLDHEEAKPGTTLIAAVSLRMPPKWHTYWANSGDSGGATKIKWQLPPGISAGPIQWPVPRKYVDADLVTYILENEALLLVPITIAANTSAGEVTLQAEVRWLECAEQCLPGQGEITTKLKIGPTDRASPASSDIQKAQAALPKPDPAIEVTGWWDGPGDTNDLRRFVLKFGPAADSNTIDFYGDAMADGRITGATTDAGDRTLIKTFEKSGDKWPASVSGLAVLGTAPNQRAVMVSAKLEDRAPGSTTTTSSSSTGPPAQTRGLLAILFAAFLGGLILNIMPCVLPVIALKILSFVKQSKQAPGRVKQLGVIYALGVWASFLVLAGLVIGIKQAGGAASWGMQFQNPVFLVALTSLVVLVSLNLFGLFEINLGGGAMDAAGQLTSREGPAGAFFNGVLATVLATPCTAPFLGLALGFAFASSAPVIILVFSTVALGLALPYVILSWNPAWLKILPKPGEWMEHFKQLMAFPMLATGAWIFSLAVPHFGKSGALYLGLFVVSLALAAYIFGQFGQRNLKSPMVGKFLALAVIVVAYVILLERGLGWRHPAAVQANASGIENKLGGIQWQSWSNDAVTAARKSGRPVLVDFTADWCLTCQVNKKTSIEIPSVVARIKELNILPLLGDYTLQNPAITAELARFGRAGVPLVIVFPADPSKDPIVLPEVLTPNIVLEALAKAKG